jgi:hypothetical protein
VQANSKSIARNTNTSHWLRATCKDSPMNQINGAISVHWTIKCPGGGPLPARAGRRAGPPKICATGTFDDASLAATSSKGAIKQNPSMSVATVSTLSENDVEDVAFAMISYKYVSNCAPRRFSR